MYIVGGSNILSTSVSVSVSELVIIVLLLLSLRLFFVEVTSKLVFLRFLALALRRTTSCSFNFMVASMYQNEWLRLFISISKSSFKYRSRCLHCCSGYCWELPFKCEVVTAVEEVIPEVVEGGEEKLMELEEVLLALDEVEFDLETDLDRLCGRIPTLNDLVC